MPSGSKAAYQVADQWKDFTNIVEMPGLFLSANSISMGANAGTDKLTIASSSDWTAVSDQEWLKLSPASGTVGASTLTLTATTNSGNTTRTAILTISATGLESQTITVIQYGKVEVTAGNLKDRLAGQLSTITNLTLIGTIDARDFKILRDEMPLLAVVDLSEATIVGYIGTEGTAGTDNYTYPADAVPDYSFYKPNSNQGKAILIAMILPSSVTTIGSYAFMACRGLASIKIPSLVTSIESFAFYNCTGLNSINIPLSVTIIGSSAFTNCTGLDSVTIPSSVTAIGNDAFGYCSGLTSVNIASSVSSIGIGAFQNCSSLTSVTIPSSVTIIESSVFRNCSSLTSVNIPSSVTSIGNDAFGYCTSLNSINIPSSVTSIGSSVFRNCSNLTSIIIPSSVTSIGSYAFFDCAGLTSVIIPSSVTTIESFVFGYCSGLTSVIIPSSVTSIRSYAFRDCSNLASIIIPTSVTSIGDYAFGSCNMVNSIYANSSVPINLSSSYAVFYGINKTTTVLNVPYGSKASYQAANQWKDFLNIVETTGFNLSANTVSLDDAAESTATLGITASIVWMASSDQTWLTVSPTWGTGNQTITLTAQANTSATSRIATVTVSATNVNSQTIVVMQEAYLTNNPPIANAGKDQTVNRGQTVTLDGSASSDSDNNPLSYKWTAPAGITLSSTSAAKPTFTAPEVIQNTYYTFSLVVNDGTADSPTDKVVITVTAKQDSIAPVIISMKPENHSINISRKFTFLVVWFSENIKAGLGCVKLYNQTDDLIETICKENWIIIGNTLSIAIKPLLANTSYYILIDQGAILDLEGHPFGGILNKGLITFKTASESVVSHFDPVWGGSGYDHMNIHIYSAKLNGVDLEEGDEIGIFDGDKCVGSGILTSTITQTSLLNMVVSRYYGLGGDGYTPGNAITYKLFDASKNIEVTNVVTAYSDNMPGWSTDGKFDIGASAFVELTGLTKVIQDIPLNIGWNIISANVIPDNPNLEDLFQSLIDAGSLKKVIDESGKNIENFGAFGGWKNNIGNLNSAKGYKVNVTAVHNLSLEGTPVQLPFEMTLNTGYNIISYPCLTTQDAKALVQTLIDAGKLKKVVDESGKTIENFGAFGGWKNNIGNFSPGKGFKVNVTENCILTIPASGTKSAIVVPELLASEHFKPVFSGNGTDHMSINLVNLQASGLLAGDEIGIFDGKHCVGSTTIGTDQLMDGSISIPTSANDELNETGNGFISGHQIELKLFRNNKEYVLKTESVMNNQNVFEKGESWFAQVRFDPETGFNDSSEQTSINCYPNPFSDELNIEIQLQEAKKLEVKIYDVSGKLVRNLYKGKAEKWAKLVWDGKNENGAKVIPGSYYLKANERVGKIILRN